MLGILVVQWIRQSEREARRIDRALDRAEAEQARAAVAAAMKITQEAAADRPRTDTE
jgi:putative copper resistance protein D